MEAVESKKSVEDGANGTAASRLGASVEQPDAEMKHPKSPKSEDEDEEATGKHPLEECVDVETMQKPLILLKDLHSLFCSSTASTSRDDMEIEDVEAMDQKCELENALGIKITASWAKAVEKSLESLFWRLYVEAYAPQIEKHTVYVADSKQAGGVKEKVLLVDAPNGLDMMLCGPVSQVRGAQSKHVVSLGGLDFWINPPGMPPQSEICVPAWLAKGTSKADQVTVKPQALTMDLFLKETGEVVATNPQEEVRRESIAKYILDDNKKTHKELKLLENEVSEKSEKVSELIQEISRLQQELSEQKEQQLHDAKALKAKSKARSPDVKTEEVVEAAAAAKSVLASESEPKDSEESKESEATAKVKVQEDPEQESGAPHAETTETGTVPTDVAATSFGQTTQFALTVPTSPTQLEDTAADNGNNDNDERGGDQVVVKDSTSLGDEGGAPPSHPPPLQQPVGLPPHLEHPESLKAETGEFEEPVHIPASDKVKFVKISVKCHSFLGFSLSGCLLWYG